MGSSDEKKIREKVRKIKLAREIKLQACIMQGQMNLEGKRITIF